MQRLPSGGARRPGSARVGARAAPPAPAQDARGEEQRGRPSKLRRFKMDELVSKGSFGKVYKVTRISDGRVFALKEVDLEGMKRAEREEAMDEARMLSQLASPHVIRYHEAFLEEGRLYIVMEYAARGTIHGLVKKAGGRGLPERQVWRYFLHALVGLAHIHSERIIHRDVKALNLMIDAEDVVKLGDLGIARALSEESDFVRTIVGTPYYLSPELCEDRPYDERSDVWALGVVLYEMLTGRHPFTAQNEGALIRKIMRGTYDPVTGPYSPQIRDVLAKCLTKDFRRRPDTQELMKHPAVVGKARELQIDLTFKAPHLRDEDVRAGYEERPQKAREAPPPPPQPARGPPAPGTPPARYRGDVEVVQESPGAARVHGGGQGEVREEVVPHRWAPPPQAPAAQGPGEQHARGGGQAPHAAVPQYAPPQRGAPFAQDERAHENAALGQFARLQVGPDNAAAGKPGLGAHAAHKDSVMGLLRDDGGEGRPSSARDVRARPDQLPPAGVTVLAGRPQQGGLPWDEGHGRLGARHYAAEAQTRAEAVWTAQYEKPTFGRRRAPDLMATGPSMRAATGPVGGGRQRPASAHRAQFAGPTYDTATMVSSTTTATNLRRPY